MFNNFFADLKETLRLRHFWLKLSWLEFYGWYGRMNLGFAWVVISPLVFAMGISVVYADTFGSNLKDHFLYVYGGYICWLFISDLLGSGAEVYTASYSYYSETKLPLLGFNIKGTLVRSFTLIINTLVYVVIGTLSGIEMNPLLVLAALFFFCVFSTFCSIVFSIGLAYVPDLKLVIQNLMRVLFFITPIVWVPSSDISGVKALLVFYNPFYYFVSIFRNTSVDKVSSVEWYISLAILAAICVLAIILYSMFSRKMVFVCK